MRDTITLLEYDSVEYEIVDTEEEGYDESEKKLYMSEKTMLQLERLNREQKFVEIYRGRIKALNYAGVAKVGSIKIEIIPKFLIGKDSEEIKPKVMSNLLQMLRYTRRLNIRKVEFAELDFKSDFFEVFVHLFAKNLLNLLKVKHDRGYVRRYDELRFVKERIDTRKYGANPAKLHRIPCIYHERSMDTPINRTLKYTSYLMLRLVRSRENYRLLKQIISILDPVELTPVSPDLVKRISFSRLNAEFEPFINFCWLFLRGCSLTLQASNVEFFSLMIPMERLFEEFIGEVIRDNPRIVPENVRGSILIQKRIGHLATKNGKRKFELRPDIRIEGVGKAIVDTKYKLLSLEERNYGVSQQDLYQMYAYCKESDTTKCLLIYPEGLNGKIESRWRLGKDEDIELHVKTVSLIHDLTSKNGWSEFIGELEETLRCLSEDDA
ncbi:McrBC 5-methylcytosine restriction system component [Archaeoglobus sulfaticallidus PM70-1]|uniref:McrBC 5-methylcytosine restriction system component n=1 Tax=Archaeoglobus sulfaticallidus PM70-1 TaxID=387631 RepID=N0BGB1_9EURY|nr:McrBC 5-methylcytosine restriction system component [Archaeoglobus sulfaticallidus]AGK61337.1 McrBC 5-methylcytosine restriction system component [Archaeoglobus sulfaticallidus PM70-1]